MRFILMMAADAMLAAGGGDAARKPEDSGQMTNAEQERRDDAMVANPQVLVINEAGRRVYVAEGMIDDLVEHAGYKRIPESERDTAPGKLPPNLDANERRVAEAKLDGRSAAEELEDPTPRGIAVGDERNARAPERRLEVSDPDAMSEIDAARVETPESRAGTGAARVGTATTGESTTRATRGAQGRQSPSPEAPIGGSTTLSASAAGSDSKL